MGERRNSRSRSVRGEPHHRPERRSVPKDRAARDRSDQRKDLLVSAPSPFQTRARLERFGLQGCTSIGQPFVPDPNTVRKMVAVSGVRAGDQVLEIGPGLGALSLALLDAGVSLIAVEKDTSLRPVLAEVLGDRARIEWGDAMRVDYRALLGRAPTTLVANLPYQ